MENRYFISHAGTENIKKDQGLIVYIGRLSPEKGLLTFLRSITLLKNKVRVLIIGDGPQRDILEAFVKDNLTNVEFLGYVPIDKIWEIMSSARVLVLPSECYEGFGRVIIEAYACGVPVVASNIGGIPEIVEDGVTGRLFVPGDPFDLAEKLEWILGLPEKQLWDMKRYVHEAASTRFNKSAYLRKLIKIYELVCSQE
jgi:glycosyltransferase involved in cell wall biosynthesis